MDVRPAHVSDARGIAEVHVASWKVAYRGMAPDKYLDALQPEDREDKWRMRITSSEEVIIVAEDDGTIVGFASYFIQEDGLTAEFNTIYLHPDHWRHGVGRQLHDVLIEDMKQKHCANAALWVHPSNLRARAFYECCGWHETGETKVEPSWGKQMPAIQYRKTL